MSRTQDVAGKRVMVCVDAVRRVGCGHLKEDKRSDKAWQNKRWDAHCNLQGFADASDNKQMGVFWTGIRGRIGSGGIGLG